ncbi:hypothetical protein MRX96_005660 [Rhipicephalus microplus]
MMKGFVVSVGLLLLNMAIVTQAIRCANPTRFKGRWVIGVDGKECVALDQREVPRSPPIHDPQVAPRHTRPR